MEKLRNSSDLGVLRMSIHIIVAGHPVLSIVLSVDNLDSIDV